jgi:hypothetical protein
MEITTPADAGQQTQSQTKDTTPTDGTRPNREQAAAIERLLTAVEDGGVVDQTLKAAQSKLDNAESAKKLPPGLKKECEDRIRSMSYDRKRILSGVRGLGYEDDLGSALCRFHLDFHNGGDPVLRYCIVSHADSAAILQENKKDARQSYLVFPDSYDFVLGSFLPAEFRSGLAPTVAMNKYRHGTNATARDDWGAFLTLFDDRVEGLTTGLSKLDELLGGGFSGLTLVGANEGDGKTSLLLSMVVAALRADPQRACLFYTIDQSKRNTFARLYSLVTGCDRKTLLLPPEQLPAELNRQIEDGLAELEDDLLRRMRFIEKSNLPPREPITVDTLSGDYFQLGNNSGASRGMLAIDMFQSLDRFPDGLADDNGRDDYRLGIIRSFMAGTASFSCPDGFPVIATSEVRKVDRNELTANDLRGSARLGSIPSNILLLWPPDGTDQYAAVVPRVLKVVKSRPGNKGILQIEFHHTICRFTEVAVAKTSSPRRATASTVRSRGLSGGKAL